MTQIPQISNMDQCIAACTACYQTCLKMAMTHCLQVGGKHVQPEHMQLMMACVEICKTAANVMLIGSPLHKKVCAACADICNACADNCESIGDMQECVTACRNCAQSCQAMAV